MRARFEFASGRRSFAVPLLLLAVSVASPLAERVAVAAPVASTVEADGGATSRKCFNACLRALRSTRYLSSREDLDWDALEQRWRPLAEAAAPAFDMTADDALESGIALLGTVDEICDTLVERRERWGVSYIVIGDDQVDAFAPVVERLAGS